MFQFTHPGRGATRASRADRYKARRFNSRTPGGVRPPETYHGERCQSFQFTHPGRGATTRAIFDVLTTRRFNSRTPGGVRHSSIEYYRSCRSFNSRTPGGVRRLIGHMPCGLRYVSIHAPREGCDCLSTLILHFGQVSIHAPREGCDT